MRLDSVAVYFLVGTTDHRLLTKRERERGYLAIINLNRNINPVYNNFLSLYLTDKLDLHVRVILFVSVYGGPGIY